MLQTAADALVLITQNRSKFKLAKQQLHIHRAGILACTNAQCSMRLGCLYSEPSVKQAESLIASQYASVTGAPAPS